MPEAAAFWDIGFDDEERIRRLRKKERSRAAVYGQDGRLACRQRAGPEKVPFFRFLLYNNGIGKVGGGFVPKRRRSAQTPDWRSGARASAQSASVRR